MNPVGGYSGLVEAVEGGGGGVSLDGTGGKLDDIAEIFWCISIIVDYNLAIFDL